MTQPILEGRYEATGQPAIEVTKGNAHPDGGVLPWVTWRLADLDIGERTSLWYEVEELIAQVGYRRIESEGTTVLSERDAPLPTTFHKGEQP